MIFKYKIIKSSDELKEYESVWKKLETGREMTAFQSYDWNVLLVEQWLKFAYNRLLSNICIAEVIENNNTVMLFPLIVQKKSLGIKWLGRKKGIYFLGIESWSDYMNAIYSEPNNLWFAFAFKEIAKQFPGLDINLNCVRDDTAISIWCAEKEFQDRLTTSVFIDLPESVEAYNQKLSKSTRQNLRTALNRMKKDNYEYEFSVYSNIESDEIINNLCDIHAKRTKVKNKKSKEKLDLLHYYSKIWHACYVEWHDRKYDIIKNSMKRMNNSIFVIVKLNDVTVGYLYGLMDNRAIRVMQNCFKMEYAFYSPLFRGTYDFLIKQIQNESKNVMQIDFTRGDEPYKYKLGGIEMQLHNYIIKEGKIEL